MVGPLMRDNQRGFLRLIFNETCAFSHNWNRYSRPCDNPFRQQFSTIIPVKSHRKGPSRSILIGNLERAMKEHQVDEAWETYKDFKRLYGYPDQYLMSNLITELSYSSDSKSLRKAYNLVVSIFKEKSVLLSHETMTKLALSLARAQLPVPASSVIRLMLEKNILPSLNVLKMVFLHLVKTGIGICLASNVLKEICCFQKSNVQFTKPDATVFNLILDACVRFDSSSKAQQIIELMPQLGVVGDAHTVVIIARVHEMNGMRDELKKFKEYIDMVPITFLRHYRQFYDSLLSLHFKFHDIDSASTLLLDLCRNYESKVSQRGQNEQEKAYSVSIGSDNIKMGLRLQFIPEQVHKDSVYEVNTKHELVLLKNGKLVLSNKGLAKLVLAYKRDGRINELSKLLITIQNMLPSPQDNSPCSDVIDACIYQGWLETAHDILEDLESRKYCVRQSSYTSLLAAYYNKNMFKEGETLLRQMRRVGLSMDISNFEDKRVLDLKELGLTCKSDLVNSIVQSIREEDKAVSFLLHEYNSSIYFFTTAKMIGDAIEAYHKMQRMKTEPNVSTFCHLISGYSSMGMYREVTVLWGDIKRSMKNQNTIYNRDLYELVLLSFIRGGYFERVMEVISFMMENNMFLDKWSYKIEFLKFHKDLYRSLSVVDAKDETQSKRIEYVEAFRKFVGIH